jgi:hypothetical protein
MTFGAAERSGPLIGGLHHVGHLVRDIEEAAALYRRLGFVVPVPEFPVLPAISGQRAPSSPPAMRISSSGPISWNSPRSSPTSRTDRRQEPRW